MMWHFGVISFVCLFFALQVESQIPAFGRCPEFEPMNGFNRDRFMGTWHEFERYFTATEVLSKCISAVYEKRADGNIYVNNHYTNRINNVQRIISGKMAPSARGVDGRFIVKYDSFPLSYNTTLLVLDTDYDNYAVIWSCSNIGPVGHTESAWMMSRERIPRGEVLQAAYGVLDKFKLNRTFFVKTQQTECETQPPPDEAVDEANQNVTKNVEFNKKEEMVEKQLEPVVGSFNDDDDEEEEDKNNLQEEDVIVVE